MTYLFKSIPCVYVCCQVQLPMGYNSPFSYTAPEKEHSALITVDVQRDFVLPGSPWQIAGTLQVIPAIQKLVCFYRDQALPIIHVVRLYLSDGSNADLCRRHLIEKGKWIVTPGSDGAELMDELKPSASVRLNPNRLLAGELQVIGSHEWILYKPRWGAFYATSLQEQLRSLGVTTIVVSGCNFPNCPRTTLYEASERDFRVVLVKDAVSGCYDRGLEELQNIGTTLVTTLEWIGGS